MARTAHVAELYASAELERRIQHQHNLLVAASTDIVRREHWFNMKALIESRSFAQIRRMERARGLTHSYQRGYAGS